MPIREVLNANYPEDPNKNNSPHPDGWKPAPTFKVLPGKTTPLLILSGSVHWGFNHSEPAKTPLGRYALGFNVKVALVRPTVPPLPSPVPVPPALPPFEWVTYEWRADPNDIRHFFLPTVHKVITQGPGEYVIEMTPTAQTHVSESDFIIAHLIEA